MRIVIAEDAALLREGIVGLLRRAEHDVVAALPDASTLLAECARLEPDVVILDIRMPPTHTTEGLEAALQLRNQQPDIGIMLLSQHVETRYAMELIERNDEGGIGYLLKDRIADVKEFLGGLERVADGASIVDPEVVRRVMSRARRNNPIDRLSERERTVLSLMAQGQANAAIAEQLVVNARTVESHVGSIFTKLDLPPESATNRRVKAVLTFIANSPV